MITTPNIRLSRILKITWKTDLLVLVSCVAAYFANVYFISKFFTLPAVIATVVGTALAFFIGFNNNQAYARWWEARIVWGAIVNNSRSWARSILSYCYSEDSSEEKEVTKVKKRMIYRHLAFLYALKAALRGERSSDYKKYLSENEIRQIEKQTNKHNAILNLQSDDLEAIYKKGWVDSFKFMQLDELIITFCDDMGRSERIKNTVFPTTYHYFTRLFIWFFGIIITIVASETTGVWSVLLGGIVSFIFHTTHIIGTLLVNPFEPIAAGIPLDQITRTIEINLLEMLEESNIPEPVKPINGEYVM